MSNTRNSVRKDSVSSFLNKMIHTFTRKNNLEQNLDALETLHLTPQSQSHEVEKARNLLQNILNRNLIELNLADILTKIHEAYKYNQLLQAVKNSDLSGVIQSLLHIIKEQEFLFITNDEGNTILHTAIWKTQAHESQNTQSQRDNIHIILALLNHTPGLFQVKTTIGVHPLFTATELDHPETFLTLLDWYEQNSILAKIKNPDFSPLSILHNNHTLLEIAVEKYHVKIIEALLKCHDTQSKYHAHYLTQSKKVAFQKLFYLGQDNTQIPSTQQKIIKIAEILITNMSKDELASASTINATLTVFHLLAQNKVQETANKIFNLIKIKFEKPDNITFLTNFFYTPKDNYSEQLFKLLLYEHNEEFAAEIAFSCNISLSDTLIEVTERYANKMQKTLDNNYLHYKERIDAIKTQTARRNSLVAFFNKFRERANY